MRVEERESAIERQGKRKGVRFLHNSYTSSWSQVLWGRLGWDPTWPMGKGDALGTGPGTLGTGHT